MMALTYKLREDDAVCIMKVNGVFGYFLLKLGIFDNCITNRLAKEGVPFLFCAVGHPPEGTISSTDLVMSSGLEFHFRIISGLKPDGFWVVLFSALKGGVTWVAWFLCPDGRSPP